MLICRFLFIVIALFGGIAHAWTEDKSCDGHDGDSVGGRRRDLSVEDRPESFFDDKRDIPRPKVKKSKNTALLNDESPQLFNATRTKNLRGRRQLGADEPTIESFKLKMYWEKDYCWQLEAFDRNWCMSCHGGSCGEDDLLWIQECNDALIQRFVWEPVSIAGRSDTGKLKPYLAQDLCLTFVGTDGTYSHFGVTNPRWWYYLLKPCNDTNFDTQIFEGFSKAEPFEFLAVNSTTNEERVLSQAHDPRAGEIILGEALHVARFDFTSLWETVDVNSDYPATPATSGSSLFCAPWPLMMTDDEDWEVVRSGETLVNWQADTFVEQYDNGRFVIQRGFPDRKETILFDNRLDLKKGDYFTKLRGNGDLLTFRGTPDDHDSSSVWKIDSDRPEGQYFLGVECDLGTVSIYEFIPSDPGDQLWSTNGTSWVPDGTTLPPMGSDMPSLAPTSLPSSSPTISVAPTTSPAPIAPDTPAPTATPTTPMPTSAPSVSGPAPEIVTCGIDCCTPTSPCEECYGDCDEDSDCQGDLICEDRVANGAVTGCSGGEDNGSTANFCVQVPSTPPPTDPVTTAPTDLLTPAPIPTSSPTDPLTTAPTNLITPAPIPTSSPTDPPVEPPSSSPSASPTATSGSSQTPIPTAAPTAIGNLPAVVILGADACTPTSPCPRCHGDCDEDSDCEGDLVCEERNAYDPVSGCSGGEESESLTDYCVLPPDGSGRSPTAPVDPPTTPATTSPGADLPVLSYRTPLDPECSASNPCEKCMGDCDIDDDCAGDLVCPDRNAGEAVPGCTGTDNSKTDFCVDPNDL